MAHDDGAVCRCVVDHRPPVLEFERHHLLPMFLGGPRDGETVWLCQNAHANVHELLRLMLRAGRPLTYRECQAFEDRPVSRYAHTLAAEGYRRWKTSQP